MTRGEARRAIIDAAKVGDVVFRYHASRERMLQRRITTDEVLHALAHLSKIDAESEGRWRVTGPGLVDKPSLTVIVAVEAGVVVVTVWRNAR